MPYNGDETLVFESTSQETDTIFLLKKDTSIGYAQPQALNGKKYELVSIFCKHSDPYINNNEKRYIKSYFLKLEKGLKKTAYLRILLSAKNAQFYRMNTISIDSLANVAPIKLQTSYGLYNDVYVFNSEDYSGKFEKRSNYITKMYWSKSEGLVRFDKKGNEYWVLKSK